MSIISVTVALLLDKIDGSAFIALVSAVLGYTFGASTVITASNGLARRLEDATQAAIDAPSRQTD